MFTIIVAALQGLQNEYDPTEQHISELANGYWGNILFLAFIGLAVSIGAISIILGKVKHIKLHQTIFLLSAILVCASGIVTLSISAVAHILLIIVGIALLNIGMLLLPLLVEEFKDMESKLITFLLSGIAIISAIFGEYTNLDGISQRFTIGAVMFWLIWFGVRKRFV